MKLSFILPLLVSALIAIICVEAAPIARALLERRAGPSSSRGVNTRWQDWIEQYQALEAKETPQIFGRGLLPPELSLKANQVGQMDMHVFAWRDLRSKLRFDESFLASLTPEERVRFEHDFAFYGTKSLKRYAAHGRPYPDLGEVQTLLAAHPVDVTRINELKQMISKYLAQIRM